MQGQFANMAGFSCGHLNRLLNRSQELPERYKARLTAALEKMQPDTITVKIDYVRIRFPTLDVREVVENVLWLRMRHAVCWNLKAKAGPIQRLPERARPQLGPILSALP